jgi:hypothetical protein
MYKTDIQLYKAQQYKPTPKVSAQATPIDEEKRFASIKEVKTIEKK